MTLAIDMIGTKFGSGTRTYNLNFCKNINKIKIKERIFIFITNDYLNSLPLNKNENINYNIRAFGDSSYNSNIWYPDNVNGIDETDEIFDGDIVE